MNRFAAVSILTTLWKIFYDSKGFDETADYILSTIQRATRTKNRVVNVQTINLMFNLMEEFVSMGNLKNAVKI